MQLIREGQKQNNNLQTQQLFPARSDGLKVTFIPANEWELAKTQPSPG